MAIEYRAHARLRPLAQRLPSANAALLALLCLIAAVPLSLLLAKAVGQGGVFTGATGVLPGDQLQYLAWVRDSGAHVLASSLFDLTPSRHVLLDPVFAPSGMLWRLGAPVQLAYLAWLPVSIAVLFGGFRAYVRRTLPDSGLDRVGALTLALLFATPVLPLLAWSSAITPRFAEELFLQALDATPALQLWGYFPIALTLGLMCCALLWSERALVEDRYLWRACAPALLASWIHPWQGATLILVLAAVAATERPLIRSTRLLLPAVAAALPLGYYVLLPHLDSAWALARHATEGGVSWSVAMAAIGPLLLVAIGRPRLSAVSFQDRVLVAWPLVVILLYASGIPYPPHAFETISLPLAVLAMRGWHFLPARKVVMALSIALLTVPGLVYAGRALRNAVNKHPDLYVVGHDDAGAFRFIEQSRIPGGVLAPVPLTIAVPAMTGRHTWIGHTSWTPTIDLRIAQVVPLFAGNMTTRAARHRVERIGAPFVMVTCATSRKLIAQLAPIAIAQRRFGCATVLQIKP